MKRQTIEEYLDGALDAAGRSEVEKAVGTDALAAGVLSRVKSERALRGAVYASYAPGKSEAADFAAQVMAACHDEAAMPVGRIGWTWARRISAVAAAVVIMAGMFAVGRMTASPVIVNKPIEVTKVMTTVVKVGPGDLYTAQNFGPDDKEKMNNFINSGTDSASGMASMDLPDTLLESGHM